MGYLVVKIEIKRVGKAGYLNEIYRRSAGWGNDFGNLSLQNKTDIKNKSRKELLFSTITG